MTFFFLPILFSSTQLQLWMQDTDVDQNGELSFEEFKFSIVGNTMLDV